MTQEELGNLYLSLLYLPIYGKIVFQLFLKLVLTVKFFVIRLNAFILRCRTEIAASKVEKQKLVSENLKVWR